MEKIVSYHKDFNALINSDAMIETIVEDRIFTEGPVWDEKNQRLLFSDIPANTIYSWSESDGLEIYRQPSGFANGLTYDSAENLIACEHQTRAITLDKGDGNAVVLADKYDGKKLNSPNDVIVANDGSILFTDPIYGLRAGSGGPAKQELPFQGVYRFSPHDDQLTLLTDSFERPNGLAFSLDQKRVFIADTVRQHIRVFSINSDWELLGGEIWAELVDNDFTGRPDGMKLDKSGNLFSTGAGGIWVFNPAAELIGRIFLPDKTSNLNWGDADRKTLYITSSTKVYRIRMETSG